MRRPARLTLGALPFELYPEGRVLVTLPATALPFGASIQATALYLSLAVFIDAMMPRMSRRV
jgi:hypothetical protein